MISTQVEIDERRRDSSSLMNSLAGKEIGAGEAVSVSVKETGGMPPGFGGPLGTVGFVAGLYASSVTAV